eukprot:bmy_08033T0
MEERTFILGRFINLQTMFLLFMRAQSRHGGGGARGAGARLSRPRSASLPRRRRRRTRGDPGGGGGGSRSRLGCSVMKRVRTEQIQMAVSCYLKHRQYGDADGPLKQGLRLSQSTEEMATSLAVQSESGCAK